MSQLRVYCRQLDWHQWGPNHEIIEILEFCTTKTLPPKIQNDDTQLDGCLYLSGSPGPAVRWHSRSQRLATGIESP